MKIDFKKGDGLVPVVIQDNASLQVLMLGYMDKEALSRTLEGEDVWFYSRSRQELWHKGGTSGHVQIIKEVFADCDDDTVVFRVEQIGGAACHTGYETCFHKKISPDGTVTLVGEKVFDPEKVYKT